MKFSELVDVLHVKTIESQMDVDVTGIETDSRRVKPGDMFIALRGFTVDGHDYIKTALERGAAALVVEKTVTASVPVVVVPDTRRAMGFLANRLYHYPSHQLRLIGVTGTNGKTTTSHLVSQLLQSVERPTGIIGTIGVKYGDQVLPARNTTPDVVELQQHLRWMVDQGATYAAMEVSSHALHLGRTHGTRFHTAVFTNLTQDHLDYHGTMEEYRAAKGLLFSQLGNDYALDSQVAVLNSDDEASHYFASITPAQVITYGIKQPADVRATNIVYEPDGMSFQLHTFCGDVKVRVPLFGTFNVYNVLAAVAVALVEKVPLAEITRVLPTLKGVDGRFEAVQAGQDYTVLVDYAHTPDSLENVLTTAKSFTKGKLICVVGCGGDRDRSKRPKMAKIATELSDISIITSDNPRTERPEAIIADMVAGIPAGAVYSTIVDRKAAIEHAIGLANAGDVVLIAGKGHETYQEINGVRYDFDDRKIARTAIKGE
jgi:UDP-N-acetylmuramoyl-L-alanyl-D-glutamate--2,6-diaminopimelate ligase